MSNKFKAFPFSGAPIKNIGEALRNLPDFMNWMYNFFTELSASSEVDRVEINASGRGGLIPLGGSSSSDMFHSTSSEDNLISVTAGVCVVGLTSHSIAALEDEAVSDDKWLVLRADLRNPATVPTYQVVDNPYPASDESYYKYWKIARFDGSDFQRAHGGGILEVDFT